MSAKKYRFDVKKIDGVIKQASVIPFKELKPKEGWQESNEPEDHLDEVARKLAKNIKPKEILCVTYKDQSLAKRMMAINQCDVETMYHIKKGFIPEYPEDRYNVSKDMDRILEDNKYDLIIMRHYLEHFKNCERILDILKKKLSIRGLIYLEVPDCQKFIDQKIPLYLWEQHRYYFTTDSLNIMLLKKGLVFSKIKSYGSSIEPSLCTFIKKEEKVNSELEPYKESNQVVDYEEIISLYKTRWKQLIEANGDRELIMFGAGHNADRFIQMTGIAANINKVLDDNNTKIDRYLAGIKERIEHTSYVKRQEKMLILLGCHDRSVKKCIENVLNLNKRVKIYSIFKLPKENDR